MTEKLDLELPTVEEIELELEEFTAQYKINKVALASAFVSSNLKTRVLEEVGGYLIQAVAKIPYDKIEEVEMKWPSNWKEAFKERWFPQWALNRWPVVYNIKKVDVRAYYPDIDSKIPDHTPILKLMITNER